jgi:hypothetical protein
MPIPIPWNNVGVGPRIGLGYPFDSTLGYPGEGPSRYPHTRREERPSLRIWSTRGRPTSSSDAVSTRLVFDDVPPLRKVAHGNSDTRLGQWLQTFRQPEFVATDIAAPRRKRVPDPVADDGLIHHARPVTHRPIFANSRHAKMPQQVMPTVTSSTLQVVVSGPSDSSSTPLLRSATVAMTSLTRMDFIVKFAAIHGVTCAALNDIWRSNKHGYNQAYDAPFARFQAYFMETKPADSADMFHPNTSYRGIW